MTMTDNETSASTATKCPSGCPLHPCPHCCPQSMCQGVRPPKVETYLTGDTKPQGRQNGRTLAQKHQEHYRSCNCLGDSSECCVETCECHVENGS